MSRVYNFSAGPAVLPESVLKSAAEEMLDYKGCGMSVMEMSHRSKVFEEIIKTAESDLRELMHIPDNYKVLFLQGGASQQFAMIPMNLMKNKVADYIVTGQWAKKAYQEAAKYGKVNKIASSEDKTFSYIPDCSDLPISEDADYVYICENNTIYGTKFKELPNTKGKTLVADVSSCFLSEPVDVSKYGIVEPSKSHPAKGRLVKLTDMVEKPAVEKAPSQLAVLGRYVLTPEIFELLETQGKGAGGEIQLTDAIKRLLDRQAVYAYDFEGKRYDVGDKFGFIKATIDFALDREDLYDQVNEYIHTLVEKEKAK